MISNSNINAVLGSYFAAQQPGSEMQAELMRLIIDNNTAGIAKRVADKAYCACLVDMLNEHIRFLPSVRLSSSLLVQKAYKWEHLKTIISSLPWTAIPSVEIETLFPETCRVADMNNRREVAVELGSVFLEPFVSVDEGRSDPSEFNTFVFECTNKLCNMNNVDLANLLACGAIASASSLFAMSVKDDEGLPNAAAQSLLDVFRLDYKNLSAARAIRKEALDRVASVDGGGLDGEGEGNIQLLTSSPETFSRLPQMTREILTLLRDGRVG